MGDRYVVTYDNKKIMFIDANNLYGHSIFQPLPYDETKFDSNFELEDILSTPNDSDYAYSLKLI